MQGGSGYAKNVTFQNVEMHNVRNPIIINQFYCDKKEPSCSEQVILLRKCLIYYNFLI
jgi:polygalacturonase